MRQLICKPHDDFGWETCQDVVVHRELRVIRLDIVTLELMSRSLCCNGTQEKVNFAHWYQHCCCDNLVPALMLRHNTYALR